MTRVPLASAFALLTAAAVAQQPPDADLKGLLAILEAPVVSASRWSERQSEAPATVIVLRREDLDQRGYRDLSQILDDLPGMQVTRPYGATFLKDYWRGYRNTIGEPFLLLMDGMVLNHLWYNTADAPLMAIPLSGVERVEVVYGPVSAVYGANAFVGVINVITRGHGAGGRGTFTAGAFGTREADVQLRLGGDRLRMRLAVRGAEGAVDGSAADRYEYLSDRYTRDRRIYGRLLDAFGGGLRSQYRALGLDLRVEWEAVEFGVQHLSLRSGYGLEYPADRYLPASVTWERPEWSFFLRTGGEIGEAVRWSALARHRRSDTGPASRDFEVAWDRAGKGFLAYPQHWRATNASLSFTQDFDIRVSESLSLRAGLAFEQKALQKGYAWSNPDFVGVPVNVFDPGNLGSFGRPPASDPVDASHFTLLERGLYLQGRWRAREGQLLHLGARFDHNGIYGAANTVRAGYVGSFGAWGVKALFGQAYQAPNARELFGGWTGSGSSATLGPERSTTYELGLTRGTRQLLASFGLWRSDDRDVVVTVAGGARNLGARRMDGAELGLQASIPAGRLRPLKVWAYLSRLLQAEEHRVDPVSGHLYGTVRIPDLSDTTLRAGFTANPSTWTSLTLRGRFIGARRTPTSNPAGEVKAYTTLDLSFRARDLWRPGLDLQLSLENAGNADYAHPGVREANAGLAPGRFDANGDWIGSAGYYNSVLPQPRRAWFITLGWRF